MIENRFRLSVMYNICKYIYVLWALIICKWPRNHGRDLRALAERMQER